MRNIALVSIVVGVISWLVGIISRLTVCPILGLESRAFAGFTALCFLLAIALSTLKEK
jgi:hypothetical protein